ncbi:MAG: hypothetical protein V3U76_08680 [Granulosicoccus sp.]
MRNVATDIYGRVDYQLAEQLNALSFDQLKQEFVKTSLAIVPKFFDVRLVNDLRRICYETIQATVHNRQLVFNESEPLSQSYRSFGYNAITDNAPIIEHFHLSGVFRQLVANITGMIPESPKNQSEQFYIVQQCGAGTSDDNWYRDDCSLSLTLIIDDALADDGGLVELVHCSSNIDGVTDDPAVLVADNEVIRFKPVSGSLIVKNGDTNLHRISPLQMDSSVRTALVLAYQSSAQTQ